MRREQIYVTDNLLIEREPMQQVVLCITMVQMSYECSNLVYRLMMDALKRQKYEIPVD
jgi:hypothetical protein